MSLLPIYLPAASHDSNIWVSGPVGDPCGMAGSWIQPGPSVDAANIWKGKQWLENFHSPFSYSVTLRTKKYTFNFFYIKTA